MSQYARVSSIVLLKQLRASLGTFSKTASLALEETHTEIQRTLMWLREDRHRYWKTQVRVRSERFVQAKLALKRREIFDRALSGTPSSCVDERKALKAAEKRLREAEHKSGRVRTWSQQIEKQLADYRAMVQGLVNAIDVEIPNARARLDKMIDSLEAYIALAPPEMPERVEEKPAVNVVQPDTAAPTAGDPSPVRRGLEDRAKALRKTTPSAQVRRQTPIDSEPGDWIAGLALSEALRAAVPDNPVEQAGVQPGDKVVLAQPKSRPDIVYLERTPGEDGDSGWHIGVTDVTESSGYVATRVVDVLRVCPCLTDIVNLPTGYLVLTDNQEKLQAIFDPHDNVLWRTSESDDQAPRG